MKKLFIFDVDDVIYDLKNIIQKALTSETGKNIHCDDWYSFNLNTVYDVELDTIFNAFHKHDILRNGDLNFEIYKVLDYLKQENIETMALTARGWHPEGNLITKTFFEENNIEINKLKVVEHHESKADYIASLTDYNIVGYIDDNVKHIHQTKTLMGNDIGKIFLKNQPWNKSYKFEENENLIRIDNLLDVNKEIEFLLKNRANKKYKNLP